MRFAIVVAVLLGSLPSAVAQDFPRRMLVVHVANPLYLEPLTSKALDGTERVRDAAERLATAMRVPNSKGKEQLFILSDALPAPAGRVPTRAAIADAVRAFCESSRGQDRILLYFAGHAVEKDGKAYFAPIEGDRRDADTLVPVEAIYNAIKAGKATQTVVVWDVCRRNPARPLVRPGSEAMTEVLAKALARAPMGVEVVLSCSPGEFALEYAEPKGEARLFAGSALVDALRQAVEDRASTAKPDANDPLPIGAAFPEVETYLATAAKAYGVKQTPQLVGKPRLPLAPFDARAAAAARVEFPVLESDAEAKAIFAETALPQLAIWSSSDAPVVLPFAADAIKPYAPDSSIDEILKNPETYPLRVAALRALQAIRESAPASDPRSARLPARLIPPITEKTKKLVLDAQGPVALALAKLEGELEQLTQVGGLREKETKRWKANYDYALAQVRYRLAILNEYNLALGHVRTETLPELTAGMAGWRIEPTEKMHSKKAIRDMATAAEDGFKLLAAQNKGTPWEVLARRALLAPPGLKWEPVPGK